MSPSHWSEWPAPAMPTIELCGTRRTAPAGTGRVERACCSFLPLLLMNTVRSVQPEILDGLAAGSPAACASRRDLRVINRLMGNWAWFRSVVRERCRSDEGLLEIGAGGGELGCALHALLPDLAGIDLAPRPKVWPQTALWFQTDVLQFSGWSSFPVVIGNLVFHHFEREQLGRIGAELGRYARVIIASEPLRRRRTTVLFVLLCRLIRAHPVTRHDGRVSIDAGFCGDELPQLLGLDPAVWLWRVEETWRGAYRLVAERRP